MSDTGIKRILVALDASDSSQSALQAAAGLASQLQAELQALFVEDINLLNLSELPFARELMPGHRERRKLSLASMQRQMTAQASRLRQLVEATAQQSRIKAEFRILRGHISDELRLATKHMDLLILGKRARSLQHIPRLSQVIQDILASVNCHVLLLQHGAGIGRPVAVLYDSSEISQRALQLAIQLAHGDHSQLTVIYPAVDEQTQQVWQHQVDTFTQALGIHAGHFLLRNSTSDALLQAIEKSNSRILVMEAGTKSFAAETLNTIMQQSAIPVIVMH